MQRKSFLLGNIGMLLAGCSRHASSSGRFQVIGGNGEPLKSTFNEDAGKVRILMLVSPT
jgi:hypothetical protein